MSSAPTGITTANAGASTIAVEFVQPGLPPEPMRGLFDVEVYGLREFALIPRNDLARELAAVWLHGELRASLHMQGLRAPTPGAVDAWRQRDNVTRLSLRLDVPPLLTKGGDPFYTGQSISAEERTVALTAIEAHREAKAAAARPVVKRPSPRKRRRAR